MAKNGGMRLGRVAALLGVLASMVAAQVPTVNQGGVLNSSSYATTNPPGSLIVIFGTNMASKAGELLIASSTPLSMQMQGSSDTVSVSVKGSPSPIYYVTSTQSSVQLPWGVTTPSSGTATVSIVVTRNGNASVPQQMTVGRFSPGIFTQTQNGLGAALAFNAITGAMAQPPGTRAGATPAKVGDHVFVYATGLGPVTPPITDGAAPCALSGCKSTDKQRTTTTHPQVLIGSISAPVKFSGLSPQFVGVYQLNFDVPPGVPTGNTVPLQIQIGGVTSTDQVTIAIQ
jgi:uncharacterized protein (TIGR03437 family)